MRSQNEVVARLQELWSRKLHERKQEFLRRGFKNCSFNKRVRVRENGVAGFCFHPSVKKKGTDGIFVCNCDAVAGKCGFYKCKHTEESVEADFTEIIKSPARCGSDYPQLAVLLWFMQDEKKSMTWIGNVYSKMRNVLKSMGELFKALWWKK